MLCGWWMSYVLKFTMYTHDRSLARATMVDVWISDGRCHISTNVCMTGRKCKNCSCFDSPYALRGCTRVTHLAKATIRIGQVDCEHCLSDQKMWSKKSQDARTAARNKDHKHLRKKLPPCEYNALIKKFRALNDAVSAGTICTKIDKTQELRKIAAAIQWCYPFVELQILWENFQKQYKREREKTG